MCRIRPLKVLILVRNAALLTALALWVDSPSLDANEPSVGVLTLHGVGSHHPGAEFDAKLRKMLKKQAGDKARVVVRSVYYHGESRSRQADLWKVFDRLEDREPSSLDQKIIRRLMLVTVGDALAYANDPSDENSFYRSAQKKVRDAIGDLRRQIGDDSPVVVVAHSLGCRVIFDYLCDAQERSGIWVGQNPPSDFQELATLRLLITTGCNLPFYESAQPTTGRRFFRVNGEFQWINYYDRDDLLGWPLRPLGGRYLEIVQDQERNNLGSTLTSHFRYWHDDELNEEIASKILGLVQE